MRVTTSMGSLDIREVAPRLFAPALIWVVATHLGPEEEFDARLQVVPQATSKDRPGRLYCRRVEVEPRREDGPAVTGEVLRSVPVAYLITQAAGHIMVRNDDGGLVQRPSVWLSPEEATRLREQGPITETLKEVAIIYRIANVVGESPTRAVEHQFGVSKATAGRWVSLARIKEHLAPSEGPGKAGG